MTTEQINVAIAESLGISRKAIEAWQRVVEARKSLSKLQRKDSFSGLAALDVLEKAESCPEYEGDIPNFCNDLGACADFERTLEPFEWDDYTFRLRKIIQRDCNKPECYDPGSERSQRIADFWFYTATAPQRCEAYLRVNGLWVDGGAKS